MFQLCWPWAWSICSSNLKIKHNEIVGTIKQVDVELTFARTLQPYPYGTSQCRQDDKEQGRRADVRRRSRWHQPYAPRDLIGSFVPVIHQERHAELRSSNDRLQSICSFFFISTVWEFSLSLFLSHTLLVPWSKWCAQTGLVEPIYADVPCARTWQTDLDDLHIGARRVLPFRSWWRHPYFSQTARVHHHFFSKSYESM